MSKSMILIQLFTNPPIGNVLYKKKMSKSMILIQLVTNPLIGNVFE